MRILVRSLTFGTVFASFLLLAADRTFNTWTEYLGGPDSSQYTALAQVNKQNVAKLQVAWTYPITGKSIFNPLVVGETMYVTDNNNIVALDAATGQRKWSHAAQGITARGMNYWRSKDGKDRRIVYMAGGFLNQISAATGEPINTVGDNGRINIHDGARRSAGRGQTSNPGRIFDDLFIIPLPASTATYDSSPSDIHAINLVTGKLAWTFHVIPEPGEYGYDTWPPEAYKTTGGVHAWSELTVDEKYGLIFIPTGTARFDFYGPNRAGNNLFANSLLALDARTGKRKWHFQTVHHDLWDYDLPVAPKLLTITHNGKKIDVVAQGTKQGFVFVFERETGKPIWPIEERKVPQSDVPGEHSSATQPFPTKPPPFARQSFTERDINPYLGETEHAAVVDLLKKSRNEGLFTPPSLRGSISAAGHNGGANFGCIAVDPNKGLMYVVSKTLPVLDVLIPPAAGAKTTPPANSKDDFIRYTSPPNYMQQPSHMLPIGPPWSTLTAYDLNTGTIQWQVPHGSVHAFEEKGIANTGAIYPRGGPIVTATGLVFSATSSDHKLRAYDGDTGKVLWTTDMGNGSDGVPAIYEVSGREFLVLPVTNQNTTTGPFYADNGTGPVNAYVAYALPKN